MRRTGSLSVEQTRVLLVENYDSPSQFPATALVVAAYPARFPHSSPKAPSQPAKHEVRAT
jgi:hypothetical protein